MCDKGVVKEYCATIGCNLGTVRSEVPYDLIVPQLVKYPRLLWKLEFYFRVHRVLHLIQLWGIFIETARAEILS